jgi:hypothetical protein
MYAYDFQVVSSLQTFQLKNAQLTSVICVGCVPEMCRVYRKRVNWETHS